MRQALDEAPGDQEMVLGELAGLPKSRPVHERHPRVHRGAAEGLVCSATVWTQHGYIGGVDPVDDVEKGLSKFSLPAAARALDHRDRRRRGAARAASARRRRRSSAAPARRCTAGSCAGTRTSASRRPSSTRCARTTASRPASSRPISRTPTRCARRVEGVGPGQAPAARRPAAARVLRAARRAGRRTDQRPALCQQPERERGEAHHHAEHPVLRAHRQLGVEYIASARSCASIERATWPTTTNATSKYQAPVWLRQRVVDRRGGGAEQVPALRRTGPRPGSRSPAPRSAGT